MAFFKKLFNKVSGMKDDAEQKDLIKKINDTYESIAKGVEDLNAKVDRASMHHALETRAPLLDYRIAEFAFSLPENLRKKDNVSKYLLKKIYQRIISESKNY